jgi:hypothetical protein
MKKVKKVQVARISSLLKRARAHVTLLTDWRTAPLAAGGRSHVPSCAS